jgi:hypothetical protein
MRVALPTSATGSAKASAINNKVLPPFLHYNPLLASPSASGAVPFVVMNSIIMRRSLLNLPASVRPLFGVRLYATQTGLGTTSSATKPRKKVTTFNDDGRVPWGNLSPMEKAARTTQQSFNLGMILLGAVLTVFSQTIFRGLFLTQHRVV